MREAMGSQAQDQRSQALHDIQAALRRVSEGRSVSANALDRLKRYGFVGFAGQGLVLTAKGRQLLAARPSCTLEDAGEGAPTLHLPDAIDRLANPRKGETALIEHCDVAAARKFHSDLQRAGLRQRITQNWSLAALSNGVDSGRSGSARHEPVAMLDARDRVHRACRVIGPEFSGLLIDICLFEKPLSGVERERRWPARSAKLAIALGLRALARHYGLTRTAEGPTR